VQLTTWYGQKLKGSALMQPDYSFKKLYDRDGAYYKITKFLNQANQKGLVDPDSGTQNWDTACAKMSSGRVDVFWYSWQVGFWNSLDRLAAGTAFRFIPVNDQYYYADADRYYGSDRMFGVGAGVDGEKYDRIMEFLDWYASPEGATIQHVGLKDFNYTVNEDGTFSPLNDNALMDNLPVPEEYGGGGYNDGYNAVNQWIVSSICVNPLTNERFAQKFWKSYKEQTMTEMKKEWSELYGAEDDVAWMKANDKLFATPSVDFTPAADNNEIASLRAEINSKLCEYTWNLIMTCGTDEEFEAMWDDMVAELDGLGYETLFENDCQLWQPEIDAKKAAAGL
jgi:multiple sugar transport system substrate-binding protein/putative aldouronate transport system substrate-binding protein